MKIGVDAMGGDFAPKVPIEASILALKKASQRNGSDPLEIILIGQKNKVEPLVASLGGSGLAISIVDAPDVIEMSDSPATAIKSKPNSSMVAGLRLCKEGKADAFVSAGNTGAQMAGSLFILGRVQGVSRPTIGAYFPNRMSMTMIFDVGASIDCKPEHLVQFAEMATIYEQYAFDVKNPKVGLLNIGEEDSKGTDTSRATFALLKEAHQKGRINFIGNIEGRDILKGETNIVICDGFVGNIVLKFAESVPKFLKGRFKSYAEESIWNKLRMSLLISPLRSVFSDMDYQEFGGVPLLGINGVSIICHGSSTPKALMNAIFRAEEMVIKKVNLHIAEVLQGEKADSE
jgi:glycerol-3-phosphate acyltransferase PlsX